MSNSLLFLSTLHIDTKGEIKVIVKLRHVGNSKVLTVPRDIQAYGEEYEVRNDGTSIIFTPVNKHKNIFATKDWQEYDYQKDIVNDSALQDTEPVGREIIN